MSKLVGIIGSGNWGSTVSKLVGQNVLNLPDFSKNVLMWVMEEIHEGEKLSHIINTKHENQKYLAGIKLPENVIAETDLIKVVESSTHLIFVLPHQFLESTCNKIKASVKKDSIGISLIKGFIDDETELILSSEMIENKLGIPVSVLSGANLANEIASEKLSTTSIGSKVPEHGEIWKKLFSKPYFKVTILPFTKPLEIFGALKNCVALGIGFLEALGVGSNAKASAIRIGFVEILKFTALFQSECPTETFLQSFALDDLLTTCMGGRNVRAAEYFVRTKKTITEVEKELLNGQKLQGPGTVLTVRNILLAKKQEQEFPFLMTVYKIVFENAEAGTILQVFNN